MKKLQKAFGKNPSAFILRKRRCGTILLKGRRKIYTDYENIDRNNIIEVLQKSYAQHRQNASEIQFLIDYERGIQPLKREKTIRPDINICVNSSLPNYIKKFKIGYNWGNPIMLIQRGDKEFHNTNPNIDDSGISALNEILKNGENIAYKDQLMAEFIEIAGIGHRMIDIKTFPNDYSSNEWDIDDSLVNICTLDSRYAFVVYYNGPGQKEMLGVSYAKRSGKLYFTCFTETQRFEIVSYKITDERPNLLKMIPIVEYERSVDRTGCFERKIKEIDALNILESDFTNDTSQRTQEMWWGDNVDFKEDENGNIVTPKSGQWILTYSADGKVAKIQPLSSTFDASSTLNAISTQRTTILQDCYVPIQYDNSGGGSTGTATDMSSGWSAAELDALQEQQMTERGKRKELKLIIRAINLVPTRVLAANNPIRSVHTSDVDLKFIRRKSVDMSIRANTFATLVSHGIHGRHALEYVDAFSDTEQTWLDSKDGIEAYQKSAYENSAKSNEENNSSSDVQNQIENSPLLDGINTNNTKGQV